MKKFISIVFLISLTSAAVFVYARFNAKKDAFGQAADFPRGALIYAQISDLPGLIRLWSDSELRRRYKDSANFEELQNRHLALKLAERSGEIYDQIGVVPDLGFASTLAADRAALAVYDIGKMEFVFVAPMNSEQMAVSALSLVKSGFDEIPLDDETTCFAKEIEVDRARQRQKILFALVEGRLILASSEKYFLRTIDLIKGKSRQTALSNEPLFRQLAQKTVPNAATVWLDQARLNDDWYFKHYWLMPDAAPLKNLRAAMLDFEIADGKFVERRVFATGNERAAQKIDARDVAALSVYVPENAPFFKLESVGESDAAQSLTNILFDAVEENDSHETQPSKSYYFRDWEKSYSYSYLDDDFSEQIDADDDEEIDAGETNENADAALAKTIADARPRAALTIRSPKAAPMPLFFDNRKAIVFSLAAAQKLDARALENALAATARRLYTVSNAPNEFVWTDYSAGAAPARAMALPALGWKIFYARRGDAIVFSGSEELINEIFSDKASAPQFNESLEKLTVIDFARRREVFDDVFSTFTISGGAADLKNDFFAGNVASLLDTVAGVERIEIKQNSAPNLLTEEIDFVLAKKAD